MNKVLLTVALVLALSIPVASEAIEGTHWGTLSSSHPSDEQVRQKQQETRQLRDERHERQERENLEEQRHREILLQLEKQGRDQE